MAVEALTDAADEDRAHRRHRRAARHLPDRQALHRARASRTCADAEIARRLPAADRRAGEPGGAARCRMPFYVSPEQMMQDKAEFARKGIAPRQVHRHARVRRAASCWSPRTRRPARRSARSTTASRFAGVGKFSEFDRLRKIGVQLGGRARAIRFSREDVRGKALANAYSQAIGDEFTRSLKPLEVEIDRRRGRRRPARRPRAQRHLPGAVRRQHHRTIERFCVIGGSADEHHATPRRQLPRRASRCGDALRLGRDALQRAENGAAATSRPRTSRSACSTGSAAARSSGASTPTRSARCCSRARPQGVRPAAARTR